MASEITGVRNFATSVLTQLDVATGHSQAGIVLFNGNALTTRQMTFTRSQIESSINDYGTVYPCSGANNIGAGLLEAKQELDLTSSAIINVLSYCSLMVSRF